MCGKIPITAFAIWTKLEHRSERLIILSSMTEFAEWQVCQIYGGDCLLVFSRLNPNANLRS